MPDQQDKPSEDEQIRRLREFMRQLEALLEAVVTNPENIILGRHHDAMQDAWTEVRPRFATIEVTRSHKRELKRVGLVGLTLVFELAVFSHARDELLDHAPELFSSRVSRQQPQKPVGWWARLRRLFRRSLKAGDVVLGSLGKIPVFGMPAEAIKQFKESVEECVAMSDELAEQ
jgi:hypothetical protein